MPAEQELRHREATAPGMLQAGASSAGQVRRGSRPVELPDLTDRINALGLQDEYNEFKERYNAWRMGKAKGAKGELGAAAEGSARERTSSAQSTESPVGPQDFAYWYPNLGEWRWRRTISFWIGLTFYEGSIFFMVSSFLGCIDTLGDNAVAMTTGGLLWGKLHFLICTYLMVVSSINLNVDMVGPEETKSETNGDCGVVDGGPLQPVENAESSDESESSVLPVATNPFRTWCEDVVATKHSTVEMSTRFRVNPFAYRTALARLNHLGVGPWPYLASLIYFTGCLTFTIGFVAEFAYPHQEIIAEMAFLLGSLQFVLGGLAECIENDVFVSLDITTAWIGSVLNLGGGIFFLVGSVVPLVPEAASFWGSFWFGVGSALFLIGGSIQLILWRDEQFGLTYLGAFNKLGGSNGQPLVAKEEDDKVHEATTFTWTSLFFIHVFCIAAALSCYDFNLALGDFLENRKSFLRLHRVFNELVPMIILHMEIALRSAVVRTPKFAPYHQLFIAMRVVSVLLLFDSAAGFVSLWHE